MKEPSSEHGAADLTFGSLFAGVGGFDLGFEAAGWTPKWQVEWDARCQSVLARHWPQVPRYGDVSTVSGLEPVDCITYGFPCQDLSVAGRRAGLDGDRSGLFFDAVRIIKEMRDATGGKYPTWAVAENVPGLLSADRGAAMGRCLDALADIGAMGIEWAVLDAQHFGVPQRRKRVFLVAWWDPRIGSGGPLLPVGESCAGHSASGGTAGSGASRHVAECLNSGGNTGGFRTEPGAHLIPAITDPSRLDDQATGQLIPAFVKARCAQSETWETGRPAPTLNAFDNGTESRATVLVDGVRRLTPRECERLMGWPDDHTRWAADGREIADSNRYKMCGNGVVAPVSEWVARRLIDASRAAG